MKLTRITPDPHRPGVFAVTFEANGYLELSQLFAAVGGDTTPRALARLEMRMATVDEALEALEIEVAGANEREALEDAEHVLTAAEVTRLTNELRILQEQQARGELTEAQNARFVALTEMIRNSNKLPNEVIPEPAPAPES